MRKLFAWMAAGLLVASAVQAEVTTETVLSGLTNPSGIVVNKTGVIFVSDSGAGKIIKVKAGTTKATDVITGFALDTYGKGPSYKLGPLGLALVRGMLVVGGGDLPDGQEVVRAYTLPKGKEVLTADKATITMGPLGPGEQSAKGEGNFYALAVHKGGVLVTANGDDTKGWVLKATLGNEEKKVAPKLTGFIATKEIVGVDAPVGMTMSPAGEIVVGQMGEVNVPGDSLLTIYDGETKELKLKAEAGMFDISALAYSPSGKLYAADFGWMDPSVGGIYQLTIDGTTVKSTKVVSLVRPSAMAFGPEGVLYVTVFGDTAGEAEPKGSLVAVKGLE